ncbi:unnamed protein product [Penicillium pancosmium]
MSQRTRTSIKKILEEVKNEDIVGVEIRLDWDLPSLVRAQSSGTTTWSLKSHIVMFKDPDSYDHVKATTCERYLSEILGSKDSALLLEMLEGHTSGVSEGLRLGSTSEDVRLRVREWQNNQYMDSGLGGSISASQLVPGPVPSDFTNNFKSGRIRLTSDFAIFQFSSLRDAKDELNTIQALDGLCQAIRPTPPTKTIISNVEYEFSNLDGSGLVKGLGKQNLLISSRLRSTVLSQRNKYCWEKLFAHMTLATARLSPRIGLRLGKGLEIPFDLMLSLSAAEIALKIEGGVVFIGYSTLLFPTAIHGNSAQFHLLTSSEGQINPYIQKYKSRALTTDVSQFKKMRCFLGWCTHADVNLGTKKLPKSIKYSGGANKGKSLQIDGFSTLFQAGASAPFSAVASLQANFSYHEHGLNFPPHKQYEKLLQGTSREVALVYDSGEQRCWLVPKLSLLLHMSQAYASNCGSNPTHGVPYVGPHSDTAALVSFLLPSRETSVFNESLNVSDRLSLYQLMLGLNTNLLSTVRTVKPSSSRKLYGFEYRDVIDEPGRGSCMKELDLGLSSKAWIEIANIADVVLICAGLGDAITATDEPVKWNQQCGKVPQGQDYLTATTSCLKVLVERKGGALNSTPKARQLKISDEWHWNVFENPFLSCSHHGTHGSGDCWKNTRIIQHLDPQPSFLRKLLRVYAKPASTSITIPDSGAVVFGALSKVPNI